MLHFPPVNMGEGGAAGEGPAQGCKASHRWNKDDGGTIGVQVQAESRGDDLGNGGGHRVDPAICPGQ